MEASVVEPAMGTVLRRSVRWLALGGALVACWACKADMSFMDSGVPLRDAQADRGVDAGDALSERDGARLVCDLLSQKGCSGAAGGSGCYPDVARSGATLCASYAIVSSTPGAPCIVADESQFCASGQICVPPDGSSRAESGLCRQICPTGITSNPCAGGGTCAALAGYPGVGYCMLP